VAGVRWCSSIAEAIPAESAVILATPTGQHVEQALSCLSAGLPVLIEKPIAESLVEGNAGPLVTSKDALRIPEVTLAVREPPCSRSPFSWAAR
jgi:hypothetical protein